MPSIAGPLDHPGEVGSGTQRGEAPIVPKPRQVHIAELAIAVHGFQGVLALAPDADSGFPELAWGDFFFYYAPDGQVPHNVQPYATIATKDYPEGTQSRLDDDR